MQAAALLSPVLAGGAAAVWGHASGSALAFYAGLILLVAALGPMAFAVGRDRWPVRALRACSIGALLLLALLAIELVWAATAAVERARAEPPLRAVFSYAEGKQDPDAFVRWWKHAARTFRTSSFVVPDPRGINPFVLEPNSVVESGGSTVQINSLGFRGPEIPLDKGEAYRIVALGESTTFGYTLRKGDEPWPRVLERMIRDELGCAAPVEVVNGGVPGWTIGNQLRRLHVDVVPLRPDLVISYHGYNGFNFLFKELPSMLVQDPPAQVERPSRLLSALETFAVRRRFLARYADARRLADDAPEVDLASSQYAVRYRRMARQLLREGIPLAVATFNMAVDENSPEDVVRFYERAFPDVRARMLANQLHTRLVLDVPLGLNVLPLDVRAGLDGQYETFYVDAAHLTQPGRERLARNLLEGLREHLLANPRMRCGGS